MVFYSDCQQRPINVDDDNFMDSTILISPASARETKQTNNLIMKLGKSYTDAKIVQSKP
jgi:hypothetical protein